MHKDKRFSIRRGTPILNIQIPPTTKFAISWYFQEAKVHKTVFSSMRMWSRFVTTPQLTWTFLNANRRETLRYQCHQKLNTSSVSMCSVELPGLIPTLDRGKCLFRAAEIPEKKIKLPSSISTISLLWSKVQSASWSSTAAKKNSSTCQRRALSWF